MDLNLADAVTSPGAGHTGILGTVNLSHSVNALSTVSTSRSLGNKKRRPALEQNDVLSSRLMGRGQSVKK